MPGRGETLKVQVGLLATATLPHGQLYVAQVKQLDCCVMRNLRFRACDVIHNWSDFLQYTLSGINPASVCSGWKYKNIHNVYKITWFSLYNLSIGWKLPFLVGTNVLHLKKTKKNCLREKEDLGGRRIPDNLGNFQQQQVFPRELNLEQKGWKHQGRTLWWRTSIFM